LKKAIQISVNKNIKIQKLILNLGALKQSLKPMINSVKKVNTLKKNSASIYLLNNKNTLPSLPLNEAQKKYAQACLKKKQTVVELNLYSTHIFLIPFKKNTDYTVVEAYRKDVFKAVQKLNALKEKDVQLVDLLGSQEVIKAAIESTLLSNYQFLKYFSDKATRKNSLSTLSVLSKALTTTKLSEVVNTSEAVVIARDLVNEPLSYLTAPQIAKEMVKLSKKAGFSIEVFNKKKIESLKMGGLLAVNRGSVDPPTFSIMEWKPKNATNKKPYVLVGKGVVYDTGGLSLKPTKGSMDEMKCDMGGAATVIGTMYAIAKSKLQIHVIGLVPATDNRPGGNAYAPGDVIKMYNGKTVEVLNTDAEGRMILADALTYAQKFNPAVVLDFATLTGSAQSAIGNTASVVMGTAKDKYFKALEASGERTYERVVRFPFWVEYERMIASTIADIKNVGGPFAGAITAGKF